MRKSFRHVTCEKTRVLVLRKTHLKKHYVQRRSLIKLSITKMVQRCVEFVEEMAKDQSLHEPYVALMECLRTNTDGKIYVENERARLTLRLALLKEKNGWY